MKKCFLLILLCFMGMTSFAQNYDIQSLKSKAEKGDAEAQYRLFYCYSTGKSVGKDIDLAARYLQMSAGNDSPVALYELGRGYRYGLYGFPIWKEKAKDCFFRASELGYVDAKKELESLTKDYRFVRRGVRRTVYNQTLSVAPQSKAVEYSNKKERLVSN